MAHRDRRGFYYRNRKRGGRVVTEYLGKGELAELLARADELRRVLAVDRKEAFRAWQAELDALDAGAAEQDQAVNLLARAALLAGGFRLHHRQWRRSKIVAAQNNLDPEVAECLRGMTQTDLAAFIKRAEEGDRGVLPKLRTLLREPDFVRLLSGDVVRGLRGSLASRLDHKNLLHREASIRQCELMAEELAGPGAPALERLLCERIATCHLHVHVLEAEYSRGDIVLEMAAFLQRAIGQAQRRYLQAIRTLAAVRRMHATGPLTMQQINVAAVQQINPAPNAPALDALPIEAKRQPPARPVRKAANRPAEP